MQKIKKFIKKNKSAIIIASIITIAALLSFAFLNNKSSKNTLKIGKCKFAVEYATTQQEQIKGLSGRDRLAENTGMLFVYDKPSVYRFWMKDMKFNLDFIWILDNEVVDLAEDIPYPKDPANIFRISPKTAVNKVLEINAGKIKDCEIKIGDKVK